MYIGLNVQSYFNKTWNFLDIFSKNKPILNFTEVSPEIADRQTDRQTDITKLIVAFRNFTNAPKNGSSDNCLNANCTKTDSVSYWTAYSAPNCTKTDYVSYWTAH
jgi:hypothetical protein